MKKIITLITILAMMIMAMLAFSACGNKEEDAKTEEVYAEINDGKNITKITMIYE